MPTLTRKTTQKRNHTYPDLYVVHVPQMARWYLLPWPSVASPNDAFGFACTHDPDEAESMAASHAAGRYVKQNVPAYLVVSEDEDPDDDGDCEAED